MNGYIGVGGASGALLLFVVKVTMVLGVAVIGAAVLRRRPAAERHLVWLAALTALLLLPVLAAVAPAWRVAVPAVDAFRSGVASQPEEVGLFREAAAGNGEQPGGGAGGSAGSAGNVATVATVAARTDGGPGRATGGAVLALGIWLAGLLVVLGTTLFGLFHVAVVARRARALRDPALLGRARRLAAELGVARPVRMIEGGAAAMPMTFGILRATLLLPSTAAAWPAARQEAVLRHELAHIRRRDSLAQLVSDLACALYWFHPLVWVAGARLRTEREHACDDAVLLAGARASDYAAELLAVARATRVGPIASRAALTLAQPSRLRSRLAAVLEERPRAGRVPLTRTVPAAALVGAGILGLAMATPHVAAAVPGNEARTEYHQAGSLPGSAPAGQAAGASAASVPAAEIAASRAPVTAGPLQTLDCWQDNVSGNMIVHDGRSGYRLVQHRSGDLELCLRAPVGVISDARDAVPTLDGLSEGDWLLLAARVPGTSQHMEIRREAGRLSHHWTVNGVARPFDDEAREWRDAVLSATAGYVEISSIRGEAARLRGRIASVRGREASLRGEIASARGAQASLHGQAASIRGREASLRGEIASLRGQVSSMRGEISSLRAQRAPDMDARVAELERRIDAFNLDGRVRAVEERIRQLDTSALVAAVDNRIAGLDTEGRVREIEERIAQLDVAGEVRALEARIAAADTERRVAALQAELEPRLAELRRIVERIR